MDNEGHTPRFPFGHGLSYTSYRYDSLTLETDAIGPDGSLEATVEVTNTGSRAGEEVVQLYVGYDESPVERAPLELEAFARVALEPGETAAVSLPVDAGAFAHWDSVAGRWRVAPVSYRVLVGPSSRELPLEAGFRVE